eukprot:scaffold228_cov312-Pinguiococcus_pyrenoidosus.AAC.24
MRGMAGVGERGDVTHAVSLCFPSLLSFSFFALLGAAGVLLWVDGERADAAVQSRVSDGVAEEMARARGGRRRQLCFLEEQRRIRLWGQQYDIHERDAQQARPRRRRRAAPAVAAAHASLLGKQPQVRHRRPAEGHAEEIVLPTILGRHHLAEGMPPKPGGPACWNLRHVTRIVAFFRCSTAKAAGGAGQRHVDHGAGSLQLGDRGGGA